MFLTFDLFNCKTERREVERIKSVRPLHTILLRWRRSASGSKRPYYWALLYLYVL